jgi:hypothetical protein
LASSKTSLTGTPIPQIWKSSEKTKRKLDLSTTSSRFLMASRPLLATNPWSLRKLMIEDTSC